MFGVERLRHQCGGPEEKEMTCGRVLHCAADAGQRQTLRRAECADVAGEIFLSHTTAHEIDVMAAIGKELGIVVRNGVRVARERCLGRHLSAALRNAHQRQTALPSR